MAKLCPSCGNGLDNDYYCNSCDKHIHTYEKIEKASKHLYNEGLELAQVRDITNAIKVLNRSLKLDKNNIEARNLLGLLYFEIGETVSALQHWVLSKHLKPENNIATDYIGTIQDNQHHLERLNNATKKYNQALGYIQQDSIDLAVIQLRKVISLNNKFVNAYNLLALCYMQDGHNDKAIKTLKKVLVIDRSNYIAKKYYSDILAGRIENDLDGYEEETEHKSLLERLPFEVSLSSSLQQLVAISIGVAIGISVMYFLIMPKEIDDKDLVISDYKAQLMEMTAKYEKADTDFISEKATSADLLDKSEALEAELKASESLSDETDKVLLALNFYLAGDKIAAANELYAVNPEALAGSSILGIYQASAANVYVEVAEESYIRGRDLYLNYSVDFREEAISLLETSVKYADDQDFTDNAFYYLGGAYRKNDDIETAVKYYKTVLDNYPDSDQYENAKWWYGEVGGE